MSETLARINVAELGGVQRLRDLGVELDEEIKASVNFVAKNALFAYQAHVPVNTFELRNTEIHISFANIGSLEAKVYVTDTIHVNSWTVPNLPASLLAVVLNTEDYKRSQASVQSDLDIHGFSVESEGTSTRGWIEHADSEFEGWLAITDISDV